MYSLESVKLGVSDFLDEEFLSKIKGNSLEKVLLGTFIGVALNKADTIMPKLKENQMVSFFEIINDNNEVDVDLLLPILKEQIQEEGIEIVIPMIDNNFSPVKKKIVFHKDDVEKLLECIKRRG